MNETFLLTCAAVSLMATAPAPLLLERKIELPDVQGRIDHLPIDVPGKRLFLAALGNDTVEVIDFGTGRRLRSIHGVGEPQGLLFAAGVNRLFAASGRDGTVHVFDGASLAPLETVRLGADADNIRL